jgi:2-keto-4-pentenoate hydratase
MTDSTLSPLDGAAIEAEAALLDGALREARAVGPSTERLPGLGIDGAYAVQRALVARRVARGARPVGRKVGLTAQAMRDLLGVDQPDHGIVLDEMLVPAGGEVEMATLIEPKVEAEIAFYLARPLAGPEVSAADVLAATDRVGAALEIVDSRVAEWRIGIADTVADNASSGLVVLGEPVPLGDLDLAAEEATVSVESDVAHTGDGNAGPGGAADSSHVVSSTGVGAAVLGHPAEAVAWLARTLAPYGEGIAAGEFVIPGSVAAALPFAAGDTLRARFASLGELSVRVV